MSEVGCCEVCGFRWRSRLCVHEIAQGTDRAKALDKRFAVLVLCEACHGRIHNEVGWPRVRQLAVLKRSRPEDMDLPAFNKLCGNAANHITMEEVDDERNRV